jgi:thiamine-monophosphate kinase
VTLVGPAGRRPRGRRGARAGDLLVATGSFGGSILGKHLRFRPRLREARALSRAAPIHAAIDVSDGLLLDAWRLASASGLALDLEADRVPIARAAHRAGRRSGRSAHSHALRDGEDYEILFAIPATAWGRASRAARRARFPLHVVGRFRAGRGVRLRMRGRAPMTIDLPLRNRSLAALAALGHVQRA